MERIVISISPLAGSHRIIMNRPALNRNGHEIRRKKIMEQPKILLRRRAFPFGYILILDVRKCARMAVTGRPGDMMLYPGQLLSH
jgi:hypothetical protein